MPEKDKETIVAELLGEFLTKGINVLTQDGEKDLTDSDIRVIRSNTDHYCSQLREIGLLDHGGVAQVDTCKNGCCANIVLKLKVKDGKEGYAVMAITKASNILGTVLGIVEDLAHAKKYSCEERDFDAKHEGQKYNLN